MKISVVIPALNEQDQLADCVASAWAARCDELIVGDGGSSDRTVEIARAAGCRVVKTGAGRARQQNAAARESLGEILLFLHADNRLDPTAGEQIRCALADPHTVCAAFRQRIDAAGWLFRALEFGNAWRARWRGLPYGDQGITVRRETFWALGGFPDEPLLEDLLLMRKLRRISWPKLLPGPLQVSARRWQRHGVVTQTLRNWSLLAAHRLGVSPTRLARSYRRHDR